MSLAIFDFGYIFLHSEGVRGVIWINFLPWGLVAFARVGCSTCRFLSYFHPVCRSFGAPRLNLWYQVGLCSNYG